MPSPREGASRSRGRVWPVSSPDLTDSLNNFMQLGTSRRLSQELKSSRDKCALNVIRESVYIDVVCSSSGSKVYQSK